MERPPGHIVNVASVPHRSLFRFPGGKTWLIPKVRQWLTSLPERPSELVEPFVGGGSVSLSAAAEDLVEHVTMVELDDEVAAVWRVVVEGDAEQLAQRIVDFELSLENVQRVLQGDSASLDDKAFRTILKNRVNRGGIMAPGAGLIKVGEGGKGIHSRWYPETLQKRIRGIVELRDRLTFVEGDALTEMRKHAHRPDAVFFIDPPYSAPGKSAGSRLYKRSVLDHGELFEITNRVAGDFLMTYDDTESVRTLAAQHGFDTETVAMKNTHHAKMSELLVGRDLDWVRR